MKSIGEIHFHILTTVDNDLATSSLWASVIMPRSIRRQRPQEMWQIETIGCHNDAGPYRAYYLKYGFNVKHEIPSHLVAEPEGRPGSRWRRSDLYAAVQGENLPLQAIDMLLHTDGYFWLQRCSAEVFGLGRRKS